MWSRAPLGDAGAQRVGVEPVLDAEDAADGVEGEPEAQVDRRQEPHRHDHDQGELGVEGEQPDRCDLDRAEAQLQRAAVPTGADLQEAAAADDPRVDGEADPGGQLELDVDRVVAVVDRGEVEPQAEPGAVDHGLDGVAEAGVDRAADVDRVRDAGGQLDGDLADVERARLGTRGQYDAGAGAAGEGEPVGGVRPEDDVCVDRARGATQQLLEVGPDARFESVECERQGEQRRRPVEPEASRQPGAGVAELERRRGQGLGGTVEGVDEGVPVGHEPRDGGGEAELLRESGRGGTGPVGSVEEKRRQRRAADLVGRLVDRGQRVADVGRAADEVAGGQVGCGQVELGSRRREPGGDDPGAVVEARDSSSLDEGGDITEDRRTHLVEAAPDVAQPGRHELVGQRHWPPSHDGLCQQSNVLRRGRQRWPRPAGLVCS